LLAKPKLGFALALRFTIARSLFLIWMDARRLVNMRARFSNPTSSKVDAVLEVPLNERDTTISSATAYLGDGRAIDTQVVDTRDAQGQQSQSDMVRAAKSVCPGEGTSYNPNVFRLPIANIPPRSEVAVDVSYFRTLEFMDGQY